MNGTAAPRSGRQDRTSSAVAEVGLTPTGPLRRDEVGSELADGREQLDVRQPRVGRGVDRTNRAVVLVDLHGLIPLGSVL